MAELNVFRKNHLDEYKCPAIEAIHFKLVRTESDIEDESKEFSPDMAHQIFGNAEMIFGYKGLKVSIYYTSAKLLPYFGSSYSDSCAAHGLNVPPDNIEKRLSEDLPAGYLTNLDTFRKALQDDKNFKPYGQFVDSYSISAKTGERQFEVYQAKIEEPGFRNYHTRLQSFIKFYIDAASYIDVDDEQWDYFLLFEKYREDGQVRYAAAGYMTVYNFYAYPARIRPRISQVLILPPFQRLGLCARLIQTFYNMCYSRPDVLDITVEDPSENFQRVRDYVDAKNCQKLKSFRPDELHKGFSHEMVHEAQLKLKLSKLQTRRVYEILRLKVTNESNKEMFRAYRLDVKRRLNIPFLKNRRTYQKLEKTLNPEELSMTLGMLKLEQKHQYLENAFQEEVTAYRQVLDRLATF